MSYKFTFANVGGSTRVRIQSGEDIRHLGELDQKMWTVLSCPTTGLEIDEQSLRLMDANNDGQLHVNEVIANADWLCSVLANPDVLLRGQDSLMLDEIADEALAAMAKSVAGDKNQISLADVDAAIAAVTIEEQKLELQAVEAPFEADVMAAYAEKKAEYASYFEKAKLQKIGLAVIPEEMAKPGMTEAKFVEMGEKIAAYEAVVAANAAAEAAAADANAAALAAAQAEFTPLRKLLLLARDFCFLLRNFVTFEDFYAAGHDEKSVFQAGTLVIDQRACHLCIRVNDMAKHDAQAAASGMFLVYCDCVSKVLGKTMKIVAAVTMGEIRNLTVGKNAIFYDRQGHDWDATITKIIDNPISIRQAFWSPYRKFGKWVTDLINKSAAEKDAKAFEDMKTNATDATAKGEDGAAKKNAFDIAKFAGIFAAIGMAVGFIGEFLVSLSTGVAALKWWQLILAIVGILLVISGPAMILAYMKLRRRNLAPLLNANGWAVNADSIVNVPFGGTLTDQVRFPLMPLNKEQRKRLFKKYIYSIILVIALLLGMWLGNLFAWAKLPSPLPCFNQPVVEEVAESSAELSELEILEEERQILEEERQLIEEGAE